MDASRGPSWGIFADWVEYHRQGCPFGFLAPHISLSRPNRLFRATTAFSLSVSLADLAGAAGFDGVGRGVGGGLGTAVETVLARLATLGVVDLVGSGEVGGLGYGTADRFGFRGRADPLVLADISLRFSCVVS